MLGLWVDNAWSSTNFDGFPSYFIGLKLEVTPGWILEHPRFFHGTNSYSSYMISFELKENFRKKMSLAVVGVLRIEAIGVIVCYYRCYYFWWVTWRRGVIRVVGWVGLVFGLVLIIIRNKKRADVRLLLLKVKLGYLGKNRLFKN